MSVRPGRLPERNFLLVAVVAVVAVAVVAAAGAGAGEPEPEVELEALMARMAASRGVVAEFVEEKELALLAAPLESRGRLYFVPPDRLARFTREPVESVLLIDGDRLRYRDATDGESLDLSGSPLARAFVENLVTIFRGDLPALRRRYRVSLVSEGGDQESEGGGWELRLEPRRAPLSRFVAYIALRGDAGGMREMLLLETDGDRTRTRFRNVALDRAFDPAEIAELFERGRIPRGEPEPAP